MKDRKASELQRKDTRRTLVSDEPSKPQGSKKDTKRWCKGKVGKEHQLKCVKYNDVKRPSSGLSFDASRKWRLLICTVCGKELDHFYAFGKSDPPEWYYY